MTLSQKLDAKITELLAGSSDNDTERATINTIFAVSQGIITSSDTPVPATPEQTRVYLNSNVTNCGDDTAAYDTAVVKLTDEISAAKQAYQTVDTSNSHLDYSSYKSAKEAKEASDLYTSKLSSLKSAQSGLFVNYAEKLTEADKGVIDQLIRGADKLDALPAQLQKKLRKLIHAGDTSGTYDPMIRTILSTAGAGAAAPAPPASSSPAPATVPSRPPRSNRFAGRSFKSSSPVVEAQPQATGSAGDLLAKLESKGLTFTPRPEVKISDAIQRLLMEMY